MDIQIEENETSGRAIYKEGDMIMAEMVYSLVGSQLLIINHTEVAETARGKGVGKKLLHKIVEKARTENKKILPLCPYAKHEFIKDSSLEDVLKS